LGRKEANMKNNIATTIAAGAIWTAASFAQILVPGSDFQPEAAAAIHNRVDAHARLHNNSDMDGFLARMAELGADRARGWSSVGAATIEIPFAALDRVREDPAVAQVAIAEDGDMERRILESVDRAVAQGSRAIAPCEGKGPGAAREILNHVVAEANVNIVCSGGDPGARDNLIHTPDGAEGSVLSALEAVGGDPLAARNAVLHSAVSAEGQAWVSARSAVPAAANTVGGVLQPGQPGVAFQVVAGGEVQVTLTRQQGSYYNQGMVRVSIIDPQGFHVLATSGFTPNSNIQLHATTSGPVLVVVDAQFGNPPQPIQFVLNGGIPMEAFVGPPTAFLFPGGWWERILEALRNPNPNPKPKACKCVKLEVKKTGATAKVRSVNKGKSTSVVVNLTVSGTIQCEKTINSEKCAGSVTVTPLVRGFTAAPVAAPLAVTVNCEGPCDGKVRSFTKVATFSFTIPDGLPEAGDLILTVAPKCAGAVAGPPNPLLLRIDSTKPGDIDPDESDSDGDGKKDTDEKKAGTDPYSWESK
jgi:hypothetical protein